jgi:DNA end-binding protein Ku
MAPRANWKGFLRLSLVTCPVALYPATSDSGKKKFNQINRNTGHRIKYMKVDADTGEEVSNEDIMKGYKVDTDTYIEVSKDELGAVRNAVGIRFGGFSGNMKVAFQATRSIG